MLQSDPSAFEVFARWRDAPANAFGSKNNPGVISDQDKGRYTLIYDELMKAAQVAKSGLSNPESVEIKSMNYSPKYGSRGHRPIDLWVSLCGTGSEEFARMPQIYAIASERGLEIGFAISINEDDYHDQSVKSRNRTIVPIINRKLPNPEDERAVLLSEQLERDGGWYYNTKARLSPGNEGFSEWNSLSELIEATKLSGTDRGGGSVCRFFSTNELHTLNLDDEFSRVVRMFHPVLMDCLPNSWESKLVTTQTAVDKFGEDVSFDPSSIVDARERVLREIAQRRGQTKFRQALLKAYSGACTVSQTKVEAVLEAAHITPYLGEHTNDISNGLLLRTDLHTLFDLHLIRINPKTLRVEISPSLAATPYWNYNKRKIALPSKPSDYPSPMALSQHYGSELLT
ncbi:HNH endonuclease [Phaeobacter gallaeciensis]|uniref:HNH endonuclease n=1 Tax=Phaeobacter gallaeciensis TaxID=60890 RepID=UPI00237FA8EC|nr:HNH endonuclease [Phaeobacter gallaeciensis]MDE4142663.1 HNH endonuclease [Phaeobacter gallaeciensis]MDE4151108.1 HNH endonuclease [Phaeobacter gallaeciensis]MDE4155337.1 HNH endonuclease [Phaeobacter gallaeciensis]MDE4230727.1 HNH endonuclease [Phaeobacter gallaeciensis]MDE4259804.1 HNH endonuclease [Phaeobacter gallaeciensis]